MALVTCSECSVEISDRAAACPRCGCPGSSATASSGSLELHRQRLVAALAAAVGMLATFLPWVHAPIVGSIPGTEGDGWITLALFGVVVGLVLAGERAAPLPAALLGGTAIASSLAGMVAVWKIADLDGAARGDNPFARILADSVSVGPGIYLVLAAALAIVISTLVLAPRGGKLLSGIVSPTRG